MWWKQIIFRSSYLPDLELSDVIISNIYKSVNKTSKMGERGVECGAPGFPKPYIHPSLTLCFRAIDSLHRPQRSFGLVEP